MNAPAFPAADIAIPAEFRTAFDAQRAAYLKAPERTHAERVADLKTLVRLVRDNQAAIVAAISADFGNRSEFETKFAEIFVVIDSAHDAAKRLARWMRPQRRPVDLMVFAGARNRLIPQPLGVVGVIVPWNYPLMLSFGPLISIFAAGNRAMVKMSENSRRLSELLIEVSPKYFPEDKLAFFDDGGGRGPAFSSLPFDHLIFTGSGKTGRAVMASAAQNLTPVTLELGGKSPAIVAPDFPIKTAAERILWAKTLNAGQTCLAVDYVFLPRAKETEFVDACKRLVAKRYPDINGPDFTAIIDQRAYDRLTAALEDARAKGATLVNLARRADPRRVEAQVSAAHRAPSDAGHGGDAARDLRADPAHPGLRPAAGGGGRDQRRRPAARPLPVHPRPGDPGFLHLPGALGRRLGQRGDPACRPAQPAVRRRRGQRDGALPRSRGLRDLFEDAARVPAGTRVVRPDDDAAALLGTGETDDRLHDPDAKLGDPPPQPSVDRPDAGRLPDAKIAGYAGHSGGAPVISGR